MKEFPERLRHTSGATFVLDASRLLLAFTAPQTPSKVGSLGADLGLMLEDGGEEKTPDRRRMQRVNHTPTRFWMRSVERAPIRHERIEQIRKTLAEVLDWIGAVYRAPERRASDALLCPLPHVLLVPEPRGGGTPGRTAPPVVRAAAARGARLREDREKSKYLSGMRYFMIENALEVTAYELRDLLQEEDNGVGAALRFETMPLMVPSAAIPNDTFFGQQWDMTQIGAPAAWDISTGDAGTVVCVLDEGCDLTHPDLVYSANGINLGTMAGDGSPTGPHGTACAGIVAGSFNNAAGVAGVAGSCSILPVAFQNWTDVEVAAGINYATANGARVISMSFGWDPWDPAIIDPAILGAFNAGLVMCVATHNHDATVTYPATNPLVIACGASDMADERKSPTSPDGECWGSNFGPEVSVVAPGVVIPTTDIQGADGYNIDGTGGSWACVNYPSFGDAAGDYVAVFDGTSAATPHVAGLAGQLLSAYPTVGNVEVRRIIERTAEKTGAVPYLDTPGYDSGTWNQETGYGRIACFRALDQADVMIRDWTGDDGVEPSSPPGGNFWSFGDLVVRIFDDDVFVPADPTQSSFLELGQDNYLYVRVTNQGPREARNVVVSARLTPYVGTQFVYPHDWTAVDATHLSPSPVLAAFATIPGGGEEIAKFVISAAQVSVLHANNWHPCVVASVNADNDYAFATAPLTGSPMVVRRNNLAQRNLSVINVLAGASASFPFLAGHVATDERVLEIAIDRARLPKAMRLRLALDGTNSAFPAVDLDEGPDDGRTDDDHLQGLEFLDRTRVRTRFGCCDGVLTLESGSRFDCQPKRRIGAVSVVGGEVVLVGGLRFVEIHEAVAAIRLEKPAHRMVSLELHAEIPAEANAGDRFMVNVVQRSSAQLAVGGASVIFLAQ